VSKYNSHDIASIDTQYRVGDASDLLSDCGMVTSGWYCGVYRGILRTGWMFLCKRRKKKNL